jgi:putative ABC transport system ATP-binding protein
MEHVVRGRGIRKTYRGGRVTALDGVDLDVEAGELVAVVGASGSGKSTLLSCLSGLETVDAGVVVVEGQRLDRLDDDRRTAHRGRRMGFVFQDFHLLPVLTAIENVELPLLLLGERPRRARRRASELLEHVGLAGRAAHRPDELSGGEQQRVAVARALAHDPAVVWADEPTGNLDSEATATVLELLRTVNREGRTVVVVTHDAVVAAAASRVVTMRDGRVVEPPSAGPDGGLDAPPTPVGATRP